jgi:hypothetical protein
MGSAVRVHDNLIANNRAYYGGALNTDRSVITVTANRIVGNQANSALLLSGADQRAIIVNNLVANNSGDSFDIRQYQVEMIHNTIVSDTGYAVRGSYTATLTLTNNLLAWHTANSLAAWDGTTISAVNNLFWGNAADPITGTGAVLANPLLAADGVHLTAGSPAINRGVVTWVTTDLEGKQRNAGLPDIGAIEWKGMVYLPVVMR